MPDDGAKAPITPAESKSWWSSKKLLVALVGATATIVGAVLTGLFLIVAQRMQQAHGIELEALRQTSNEAIARANRESQLENARKDRSVQLLVRFNGDMTSPDPKVRKQALAILDHFEPELAAKLAAVVAQDASQPPEVRKEARQAVERFAGKEHAAAGQPSPTKPRVEAAPMPSPSKQEPTKEAASPSPPPAAPSLVEYRWVHSRSQASIRLGTCPVEEEYTFTCGPEYIGDAVLIEQGAFLQKGGKVAQAKKVSKLAGSDLTVVGGSECVKFYGWSSRPLEVYTLQALR